MFGNEVNEYSFMRLKEITCRKESLYIYKTDLCLNMQVKQVLLIILNLLNNKI